MKLVTLITLTLLINATHASETSSEIENSRLNLIKKISEKNWRNITRKEIIETIKPECTSTASKITCNENMKIDSIEIMNGSQYDQLLQISFSSADGCKQILNLLTKKFGKPSMTSPSTCGAKWKLGKNIKYKEVNTFTSIVGSKDGESMNFQIGSEQGDN